MINAYEAQVFAKNANDRINLEKEAEKRLRANNFEDNNKDIINILEAFIRNAINEGKQDVEVPVYEKSIMELFEPKTEEIKRYLQDKSFYACFQNTMDTKKHPFGAMVLMIRWGYPTPQITAK